MVFDYEDHVAIDFEAYYDDDNSVAKIGPNNYTKRKDFDPYLVSVYSKDIEFVGHPSEFKWELLKGKTVATHNALFEWYVLDAIGVEINFTLVCTAALCRYMNVAGALADAMKGLYGVVRDKSIRDVGMKGKHWKDFTAEEKVDVKEYALDDSKNAWQIWADYGDIWPEKEYRIWLHTCNMLRRGIRVDVKKLDEYLDILANKYHECLLNMPWVDAGAKPGSPKAVRELCRLKGLPVPKSFAKKDAAFLAWIAEYKDEHKWISAFQDHKSINNFRNRLLSLRNRIDGDILYYDLKYCGARTGRWTGSGSDEGSSRIGGWNALTMRKESMHGCNERSLIIPREGKKFLIADWCQIEPRILFVLCEKEHLLNLIRGGMSVYDAYARTVGMYSGDGPLKKADSKLYGVVKAIVIGLGYGMGAARFIESSHEVEMDLVEAKAVIYRYRYRDNKEIPEYWEKLEQIMKSHNGALVFKHTLPSGRPTFYYNIEIDLAGGNLKTVKNLGAAQLDFLWGGTLTENCWGGDTQVLTDSGIKRIKEVTRTDLVFDGHEFVACDGAINNGIQEVGQWLTTQVTSTHRIHDGKSWREVQTLDASSSANALAYGSLEMPKYPTAREVYPHIGSWESTGQRIEVFDIVNCGPRHQYCVITPLGPVISHNCCQAIGRDILCDALLKDVDGEVVLHVYDEVVWEVDEDRDEKEIMEIMEAQVPWMPDLPVEAEFAMDDDDNLITHCYVK